MSSSTNAHDVNNPDRFQHRNEALKTLLLPIPGPTHSLIAFPSPSIPYHKASRGMTSRSAKRRTAPGTRLRECIAEGNPRRHGEYNNHSPTWGWEIRARIDKLVCLFRT